MRFVLLAVGIMLLFNCSRKPDAEARVMSKEEIKDEAVRYGVLAEDICVCNRNLIALFKEIEGMEKERLQKESKELKKRLQEKSKESEACMQKLKKAYSKANELDEVVMENALKEHCGDFYNMLKIGRM